MASGTEGAVKRLEAALRRLEAAVERRLTESAGAGGLLEEVEMLTADRAQLAERLDGAQARAARLEHVNRDVSRRFEAAVDAIRSTIDGSPGKL